MGSNRTNQEIAIYTATVIQELEDYLQHLQQIGDQDNKRSEKIAHWVENWIKYLKTEGKFNPRSIKALSRGSIVYADFGFNVGMEYGGLHYAIVLNKKDSRSNHLLQVLPLTSVKETTDMNKLKYFQLPIGDEVFQLLRNKVIQKTNELNELYDRYSKKEKQLIERARAINSLMRDNKKAIKNITESSHSDLDYSVEDQVRTIENNLNFAIIESRNIEQELDENSQLLKKIDEKLEYAQKTALKTQSMNKDSIVLLNQVTTISKLRLYDPKNNNSILNGIVLSNDTMDKIDEALKKIF